jgi:hypothetical protein
MCGIPVEMLTAVPALAGALAPAMPGDAVVVAPDLGAVKLAVDAPPLRLPDQPSAPRRTPPAPAASGHAR